jgi:tetratricopeptide (TPR) repeat protein
VTPDPARENAFRPGETDLSVAMIVRDEAEMLPGCLANIAPLEAEVCVLDTGSRDATPAIAREHGCRVETAVWNNDFSAARNASLRMCSGAWIFVIDADERLAPEDLPRFRVLLAEPRDRCWRFITRNYTRDLHLTDFTYAPLKDPHARGYPGWYPSGKVRLFPNLPGIEFRRPVHELINDSLEEQGITVYTSDIPVHHYPLEKSAEAIEKKRRLYIDLGRAKVADDPENPRWHDELATQHMELGEYQQALKHYNTAMHLAPDHAGYFTSAGAALHLLGQAEAALQALRIAVRKDPEYGEAWRNLGVVLMHLSRPEEGAAAFRELLRLSPQDSEAHRYMGVALAQCAQPEGAAEAAARAILLYPGNEEARALYEDQMTKLGRGEEAAAFLGRLRGG